MGIGWTFDLVYYLLLSKVSIYSALKTLLISRMVVIIQIQNVNTKNFIELKTSQHQSKITKN